MGAAPDMPCSGSLAGTMRPGEELMMKPTVLNPETGEWGHRLYAVTKNRAGLIVSDRRVNPSENRNG